MSTTLRASPPLKNMSSCVRPGVREMRARFLRPLSALTRLDLPTFERPAKAISTPFMGGSEAGEPAAATNCQSPAKSVRPVSISKRVNWSDPMAPAMTVAKLSKLLLRLLLNEHGLDIVEQFDLGPVLAHDDTLLHDRQQIVPGPINHEASGEACQHEREHNWHPVEDHRLRRIGRLGVELHLNPHGHAHDERPDAHMQKWSDQGQDRGVDRNESEQIEDIGWILRREIVNPTEKRRVPHFNGDEQDLVEREKHRNLDHDRQAAGQRIDLFP